jgi:hypothetical protein
MHETPTFNHTNPENKQQPNLLKMLNTELLITYGFEKISSTPLEKWCFENIILYVENHANQTSFRVSDVNNLPITLYIRSEADLQFILKTIDEGGSISSIVSKFSKWEDSGSLEPKDLLEILNRRKN